MAAAEWWTQTHAIVMNMSCLTTTKNTRQSPSMTQPCTASYIVHLFPTAAAAQPPTRSPLARYTTELVVAYEFGADTFSRTTRIS